MKLLKIKVLAIAMMLAGAWAPAQDSGVYSWRNFVGSPGSAGTNDGTNTGAQFYSPVAVAFDRSNNLYVADYLNSTIRKVTGAGVVSTFAGSAGNFGTNNGTGTGARFESPTGVAVDPAGNVYVAEGGDIRMVTPGGVVSTLPLAWPALPLAVSLAVDGATNIYVADAGNSAILKASVNGSVTVLAGSLGHSGTNDGTNGTARFNSPEGITVDNAGNVFVSDTANHTVRMVTSNGVVTTIGGIPLQAGTNDGALGIAQFDFPMGLAVGHNGVLFVADRDARTIRRMSPDGTVTTIGGTASIYGSADGTNTAAQFHNPTGVAMDATGRLFVADALNERISRGTELPLMRIQTAGTGFRVLWPSSPSGFDLQQNGSVTNSAGWSSAGYGTNDDGTNNSVLISTPTGSTFFRLIGY